MFLVMCKFSGESLAAVSTRLCASYDEAKRQAQILADDYAGVLAARVPIEWPHEQPNALLTYSAINADDLDGKLAFDVVIVGECDTN